MFEIPQRMWGELSSLVAIIAAGSVAIGCVRRRQMRFLTQRIKSLEAQVQTSAAEIAHLQAQLEQREHEQANLYNRLCHDLRVPLTAILGFAGILQKGSGELTPKQMRFVESIQAGGTNLLRIIGATEDLRAPGRKIGAEKIHAER
jgi:signal transduction histidine kinase